MSSLAADIATVLERYREIRALTVELTSPLTPEDCQAQSMSMASPVKWHLAHTTWFFETFLLNPYVGGYTCFDDGFGFLFNSYYNSVGARIERASRGLMTRPSREQVLSYRHHVDRAMQDLLASSLADKAEELSSIVDIGLQHEQQHQELILTDVKHLLSLNPLRPSYGRRPNDSASPSAPVSPLLWMSRPDGIVAVGHDAQSAGGFAFDNETPRHKRYVAAHALSSRLVTCGEYEEFVADDGYRRPELWLSDGWDYVQSDGWKAPLYWEKREDDWSHFTLYGLEPLRRNEPVCHVSYFEADAFARWRGQRLPREEEWEAAAPVSKAGHFCETGVFHPVQLRGDVTAQPSEPYQMFGDVWEWTQSQYTAYPGYVAPSGALGEYNGKFMCNQFVLRGGSCTTSQSHIRATYRNFFPPELRWQFSGIRLGRDE